MRTFPILATHVDLVSSEVTRTICHLQSFGGVDAAHSLFSPTPRVATRLRPQYVISDALRANVIVSARAQGRLFVHPVGACSRSLCLDVLWTALVGRRSIKLTLAERRIAHLLPCVQHGRFLVALLQHRVLLVLQRARDTSCIAHLLSRADGHALDIVALGSLLFYPDQVSSLLLLTINHVELLIARDIFDIRACATICCGPTLLGHLDRAWSLRTVVDGPGVVFTILPLGHSVVLLGHHSGLSAHYSDRATLA